MVQPLHGKYHTKQTHSYGNKLMHTLKGDENQLVYELPKIRYRQLQFVSYVTYGMAAYFMYLSPDILISAFDHDALNFDTGSNLFCLLISGFVVPGVVQYARRQLVLKLYYNSADESYKMVTSKATLRQRISTFKIADLKKISPGTDGSVRTKFSVNKKSFIVYPFYFKVPADYNHMFGFGPGIKK